MFLETGSVCNDWITRMPFPRQVFACVTRGLKSALWLVLRARLTERTRRRDSGGRMSRSLAVPVNPGVEPFVDSSVPVNRPYASVGKAHRGEYLSLRPSGSSIVNWIEFAYAVSSCDNRLSPVEFSWGPREYVSLG